MKRINKITSWIVLAGIYLVSSCTSDRGGISPTVSYDKVPAISTNVNAGGSQSIDVANLASFKGKIDIAAYFADQPLPEKVDVVVRKNASNASAKVFKEGVTSLPASFEITAADLTALFGEAPKLGDSYDFSVNIYTKDGMFEGFPQTGVGMASGVANMVGFSYFARFGAICAYDSNIFQGDFEVVSDAFEEYAGGEIITLTKLSETTFSFIYTLANDPVPVVITVNPINNTISSFPRTSVGSSYTWPWSTYTGAFLIGQTGGSVAPCDGKVTLMLDYGVDAGNFSGGPYALVLVKKK